MLKVAVYNRWRVLLSVVLLRLVSSLLINMLIHSSLNQGAEFSHIYLFVIIFLTGCGFWFVSQRPVLRYIQVIMNIVNQLNDIVLVKNNQGKFTFCNEPLARLYNTSVDEMIGKDDYDFTGDREQTDLYWESALKVIHEFTKEEVYEKVISPSTGETLYYHVVKIPFISAENDPRVAIIGKDITDIMTMKEESESNKKRLEYVLDVSEEGLWEWDLTTDRVTLSPRLLNLIGMPSAKIAFSDFKYSVIPEDRARVTDAFINLREHNQPYNIEFRFIRPSDGELIWLWDRAKIAEFDSNGHPALIVGISSDITTDKLNQQKVEKLAYEDHLTGLFNRTQMQLSLNETILNSSRLQQYSAVLTLDLDRFKLFNDSYGHDMGDRLLKLVATQLKEINQNRARLSRTGSDEFVIVYPILSADAKQALQIINHYANQIMIQLSKTVSIGHDKQTMNIDYDLSLSIGGVIFNTDAHSSEILLQLAAHALSRAKSSGGHTTYIFDVNKENDFSESRQLLKDIQKSVQAGHFCIYLQPMYNGSKKLTGAEALVRWNHPEKGLLSPAMFIDLAEESNLIIEIGNQVLKQACQILHHWQRNPATASLTLSINLSAKQIWRSQFVADFLNTVERYQIDRTKLIVEVTESLLIQDIKDATDKLNQLKAQGIEVSLDDFGTGYSSLSYLKHLPIDEIKIDRSFIMESPLDNQTQLMIKSIIDLAKNFKLRVVAEGIETQDKFDLLNQYGVDIYQGFFLSKPLSVQDFEQILFQDKT